MKKILLLLLLSLGLIGSTYASDKEATLARECIEKIKEIDPNRNILPYKISKSSYYPLDSIRGKWGSEDSFDQDNDYCAWFGGFFGGDAIYGSSVGCAYGSLDTIEIILKGSNRFNEAQNAVFVCAFRGCNYVLDGIRVESSGRDYSEKMKKKKQNTPKLNIGHIIVDSPC